MLGYILLVLGVTGQSSDDSQTEGYKIDVTRVLIHNLESYLNEIPLH